MPHHEYTPIRELHGGQNKVILAERKGKQYALKLLQLSDLSQKGVDAALAELKLLRTLKHAHIVKLRECEIISKGEQKVMMIATDFADGGSLSQLLSRMVASTCGTVDPVWLNHVARWFSEVVSALEYCHEHRVIHRDLKLENVLVSAEGHALIADFGFARELSPSGFAATLLGTPLNMAPELWGLEGRYGVATDLWALGCMLFELVGLKHPFERAKDAKTLKALVTQDVRTCAERLAVAEVAIDFVIIPAALAPAMDLLATATELLSQDPKDRPTCQDLIAAGHAHAAAFPAC